MDLKVAFVVSVASLFAFLPVVAAENLVTGYATRTFDKIVPSLASSITEGVLASAGTPIFEMRIDVNTIVLQARITVEPTDAEKAGLAVLPGGVVYSYVNVTAKNIEDSDLDSLTMKFRVARSWISENNVVTDSVKMVRLSSGEWQELDTAVLSEDSDFVTYQSDSPGFSMFAIVGDTQPSAEPVAEVPETIGGPEITEVAPGEDISARKIQENITWIAIGIIVVVIVVVLFFLPGSIVRKKFW